MLQRLTRVMLVWLNSGKKTAEGYAHFGALIKVPHSIALWL